MPIFRRRERATAPIRGAVPAARSSRPRGRTGAPARDLDDGPDWRSYDSVADAYLRIHQPRHALAAKDLVELAEVMPGARVLDVGTGTGVVARAAASAAGPGGLVVGIDPSMEMLRTAAPQGGGARYAAARAIDLPFRDGAFDDVFAAFVLSHFTKYDTALFDVMRVLKRGGRLGVATWGAGEDEFERAWGAVTFEFAEPEVLRDAKAQAAPWEERFADPERLKLGLHDAGLRDILISKRQYRYGISREDYLAGRETSTAGRFLRQMLGEALWPRFQARAREVFEERFDERFNDFRDVVMAIGFKG
jgi:ubiquinone/menaquinone biosynthesis C-methylase UbiE